MMFFFLQLLNLLDCGISLKKGPKPWNPGPWNLGHWDLGPWQAGTWDPGHWNL